MRIIRKKCLELNVMNIAKPCCEIYKKTIVINITYQFCGRKHDKNVSFPQIIRLAEIYSFIEYPLWLQPGVGSLKTAETMNHTSTTRKSVFCQE